MNLYQINKDMGGADYIVAKDMNNAQSIWERRNTVEKIYSIHIIASGVPVQGEEC